MTEPTPFGQLQAAIKAYGEAAMENLLRCRALGHAVVEGLPSYLQSPPEFVSLVPPDGPFVPHRDYGDDAFSYDQSLPIRLEPIAFGVCLVVPNVEDQGSLWVRAAVRVDIRDERFDVFVGRQPRIRLPLAFEGELLPLFETMTAEWMSAFRRELAEFGDARYQHQLGFVPSPAQ